MDRKGRMVWYYADPASNATSSFQRRARDGEYLWIEKRPYGRPGPRAVLKTTLDDAYSEEVVGHDVLVDDLYQLDGAHPQNGGQ